MVGVSFTVNSAAVAVNVAVVEPLGTLTTAGTLRSPEVDARLTLTPVEVLTVTVHVLDAPGARFAGMHARLLMAGRTPTEPPVPVIPMPLPAAEAASGLLTAIAAALFPNRLIVTVAITPSPITLELKPDATHVYPLAPFAQASDLPADAADSAGPAATFKIERALAE